MACNSFVSFDLEIGIRQLQKDLADIEPRGAWIVADYPVELTFWDGGPGLL
jgi:hypothetical protein